MIIFFIVFQSWEKMEMISAVKGQVHSGHWSITGPQVE